MGMLVLDDATSHFITPSTYGIRLGTEIRFVLFGGGGGGGSVNISSSGVYGGYGGSRGQVVYGSSVLGYDSIYYTLGGLYYPSSPPNNGLYGNGIGSYDTDPSGSGDYGRAVALSIYKSVNIADEYVAWGGAGGKNNVSNIFGQGGEGGYLLGVNEQGGKAPIVTENTIPAGNNLVSSGLAGRSAAPHYYSQPCCRYSGSKNRDPYETIGSISRVTPGGNSAQLLGTSIYPATGGAGWGAGGGGATIYNASGAVRGGAGGLGAIILYWD